jgi:hypothetical protein
MIVYITTNLINGKKYIGSDSKNNPNYLGSGVYLNKAIKKYGKENFKKEILAKLDSKEIMKEIEEYYIDYYNAYTSSLFYNATKYSSGLTSFPKDKIINIINANKGNQYHKGYKQSDYQKQQTRKANKGKKQTYEHILPRIIKNKKNKYALGNKFTEEQKQKISKAKTGHVCYENKERNKKISEKNSKPILQYDKQGNFIKEWSSIKEVCLYFNITGIHRSLNDWNKNSKGFKFKYK